MNISDQAGGERMEMEEGRGITWFVMWITLQSFSLW